MLWKFECQISDVFIHRLVNSHDSKSNIPRALRVARLRVPNTHIKFKFLIT